MKYSRSRNFVFFVLLFFCLKLSGQTASAPSGTGTSSDPYLIATLNNLYWISVNSTSWSKYFKQTANIDASGTKSWNSGSGFSPIGNATTNFTGTYDGGSYTISGLYISRSSTDYIGLFGYNAGYITNIKLTGININGHSYVGGIAGYNYSAKNIYYSAIVGKVNGTGDYIGGITGYSDGLVGYCTANDTTTSISATFQSYIGGITGYNTYMVIECYSSGYIKGIDYSNIGGIAGYNTGIVTYTGSSVYCSGYSYVGGVCGTNYTTSSNISESYSTGEIYGNYFVGGITSRNFGTIDNTYQTGSVLRIGYSLTGFGGIVSTNIGSIYRSYSVGNSSESGIASFNTGTIVNTFWDNEAYNITTSDGGTGLATSALKLQSTLINAGWDFVGETSNGTSDYWAISSSINNGYPCFKWQGTLASPTVTTSNITQVLTTTATGNGSLTSLGFPNPTAYGICWNTSGSPTISNNIYNAGEISSTGNFSISITGLSANTTYYARAFATNANGTSYGSIVTFKTGTITDVNDLDASSIQLFPNPVTEGFTIQTGLKNVLLRIYDYTGRIILTKTISETAHIDLNNINPGVYIVEVNKKQIKIIKQPLNH